MPSHASENVLTGIIFTALRIITARTMKRPDSWLLLLCVQCRQRLSPLRPLALQLQATQRLLKTSATTCADRASMNDSSTLSGLSSLSSDSAFNILGAKRGNKDSSLSYRPPPKPHHLHIYATRHNCHISLTAGNRDAILSVSSGTLNFRKAARGSYDAAFQLGAFVMAKIKNMGLLNDAYTGKGGPIRALEVVYRDFGPGRDAVTKILMGQEGKDIRRKVTRVMDGTRLKFGGTRSKKRRRLG